MKRTATHKKLIIICGLIITLGALWTGQSIYAYLTASDSAVNNLTIGINTTEIVEEFTPPEENLNPGDSFTKKVQIKNTGSVPCYIRVFVGFDSSEAAEKFSLDFNTESWTSKQDDGYYYYKTVIQPDELTEPLFTTVTCNDEWKLNNEFEIIVYEESVQSEGFSSYAEAFLSIQ